MAELSETVKSALQNGCRLGLLTAHTTAETGKPALITLLLNSEDGTVALLETPLKDWNCSYPSLTAQIPQAHWFERAVFDLFGLYPKGHPRFKSLIMHEVWDPRFHPLSGSAEDHAHSVIPRDAYSFMRVDGEGVYEIPVGPIHAGIIEPGHFRFSCLGEVIQNLEIRLGYQHRGIEQQITQTPWKRARFLAESAASDTCAANALAHALAVEQVLGIEPSPRAAALRAIALESERVSSHIGDLAGICSDIGYAGGAAVFARLRGSALGIAERLSGSRFLNSYILPGGVTRDLPETMRAEILGEVDKLSGEMERAIPLLMDNSGALDRMEGFGKVRNSLARDFGLVGPAGRASGVVYDVRKAFPQDLYGAVSWEIPHSIEGDVLARVNIRVLELGVSLRLLAAFLKEMPAVGALTVHLPDELPPLSIGIGVVEAWRGELIHLLMTDANGKIERYCIKDPSFNNWTGLSIAARDQLVADFPLCNKSFSLSYSGNDL